jgi:hypothetical protein
VQAFKGEEEMQRNELKSPLRCVRNAHSPVKCRLPRGGHDAAIKLSCSADGF